MLFACLLGPVAIAFASVAEAETRTLKLYYIHTGERAEITFKKDGRYIQSGLDKLNRFLRDWRRNEPTRMDPQLFDIIWEAYRMTGSREYIHVVSAYRSPATNEMLRRTRGGQAKKSQHMLGKAMDFFIPGVKLSKLREIGFKLQGGGVGYYPKSGSPFVHLDTGSVRAWPRMSRAELQRVFPNGGTLHLPPDGKPLPGYQQALASYKARKSKGQATAIASAGASRNSGGGGGGLLAGLFGGGDDEEEDVAESVAPVARSAPAAPAPTPPQPVRESPGSLMAALVPRETPLPQFAPRPAASIPLAASAPSVETVLASPAAKALTAAVPAPGVPLPGQRPALEPAPAPEPQVVLASADPSSGRRTATQIEAALDGAAATPKPPADKVRDLIDSARNADIDLRAMQIPLPTVAPRADRLAGPKIEVASLPAGKPDAAIGSPLPADSAIPVPGARAATEPRPGVNYDTGVETTEKAPRPTNMVTASTAPSSQLVPAEQIDPSRFGTWTTAKLSVTDDGRLAARPAFIQNVLREAPTTVYTKGFARSEMPDPRRFSGNAVTFLTVAKFEGGKGGDGQPLMLQIPVTD